MKKVLQFLFLLLPVLSSCKKQLMPADISDFENYQVLEKSDVIGDTIFLGRPSTIRVMNNWLVLSDRYDKKLLSWVSPDWRTSKHNVNQGDGPFEFLPPIRFYSEDGGSIVKIVEVQTGEVFKYDWKDVSAEKFNEPVQVDKLPIYAGQVIPCGAYYVANDMKQDYNMFSLLSVDGNVLTRFGKYPGELPVASKDNPMSMTLITQCSMAYNESGQVMAAAGYMSDMLSFYKIDDGNVSLIKEYFTFNPQVDLKEGNHGVSMRRNGNTLDTYIDICSTESGFYALYWGSNERNRVALSYVQAFNLKGEFIKGYQIKEHIGSIAVDEERKLLYGINIKGEPSISIFEL
ncbi:MAG: hypothetical protein IJ413_02015 [Bacteroides sp.]|nr:hypothetical protein [Bacteroides sp.]